MYGADESLELYAGWFVPFRNQRKRFVIASPSGSAAPVTVHVSDVPAAGSAGEMITFVGATGAEFVRTNENAPACEVARFETVRYAESFPYKYVRIWFFTARM